MLGVGAELRECRVQRNLLVNIGTIGWGLAIASQAAKLLGRN